MTSASRIVVEGGNTRFKVGLWDGARVLDVARSPWPDSPGDLPDRLAALLRGRDAAGIAAASASLRWREPLFASCRYAMPELPLVVARQARDIPMDVAYGTIDRLGVDRVLAALAAAHDADGACVVVDAGTAVTVDAVTGNGTFAGGFIHPGIGTLAASLADRTGLPLVEPSAFRDVDGIGTDTASCIGNALVIGFRAAVAALIDRARAAADHTDVVFVTGGGAEFVAYDRAPLRHVPDLVLRGLGLAAHALPVY